MADRAPIKIGMTPTPPGDFFRGEVLEPLDIAVSRAADLMGARRATLTNMVSGHEAFSAEMALRVELAFGVSMDTLLRLQAWHQVLKMRRRAGELDIPSYVPLLPPR